jgi:Molybdopterin-guanine dinucleotide biosynthesis protein A
MQGLIESMLNHLQTMNQAQAKSIHLKLHSSNRVATISKLQAVNQVTSEPQNSERKTGAEPQTEVQADVKSASEIQNRIREPLPLPLTAIILCGGKSKRMGRPKAFLRYEGTTIIAHIISVVGDMFQKVILVSNEPDAYEDLGLDVVKDILPYRGPMGGILSGLLVAETDHAFVMACDMPLVNKKLVRDMTEVRHGHDVVVLSHSQGLEPLLGVYSKSCIKPLEESLFAGKLAVQDLLGGLDMITYDLEEGTTDGDALPAFFNINTPQDYAQLLTKSTVQPFPNRRRQP